MGFIIEQEARQDTKDYLLSLHLKTDLGKEINLKWLGRVVIEEETNNMLFRISIHSNYPESIYYEYVLVYKKLRVLILLESFNPYEHKILSLNIPEAIWQYKENILNLVVEMIYLHKKFSGPEKAPENLDITREKFIVNTNSTTFYKERTN